MNAGLGNLALLKAHLLAAGLQAATEFDTRALAIGKGVAAMIDTFTNRKMAYAVDYQEIIMGDRDHYFVERFPFVTISAIEMKYFRTDNWTSITDQPISENPISGLVHFGYTLGRNPLQCRLTYTGGYWFETKDQGEDGFPSAPPDGVSLLPDDVQLAWLLQSAEVWNKIDKLGAGIAQEPDAMSKIGSLELSPFVKQMLRPHVRYQLS
jgi:hypothetical protein